MRISDWSSDVCSSDLTGDIAPYFYGLLAVVGVLAVATACRFYFESWLGERVVADIRLSVHNHLLTLAPGFFEENRPSEIASRLTADTSDIEQVVGSPASIPLRSDERRGGKECGSKCRSRWWRIL